MPRQRIAVVGAGVFGSWIALLAARAGFKTVLIDRYGPANEMSSSGGSSRIIRRAYGADEIYTLFAERSRRMWTEFFAGENRPHLFRRTGVLWMAKVTDASIHSARAIFGRHRLAHEFLDSRSIRDLCPGMNVPDETVALFESDCGALLAEETVRAVAESAIHHGVRYVSGGVKPPESMSPLHSLEMESGEQVKADLFIFACGSWLPKLFPEVLGAAIFPTRQEVFYFDPPTERTPPLPIWVDQVDPRVPYVLPDIEGAGIKVAFHRTGPGFDPDGGNREIEPEQIVEAAEYLRLRFAAMRAPKLRRVQACHYENTSSGDFLIDRHPAIQNVWFAGGGSGHGFKHAPAVAKYLLDAIKRGDSPEPRFRLETKGKELARHVV